MAGTSQSDDPQAEVDWPSLLADATPTAASQTVSAIAVVGSLPGASTAMKLRCDDNKLWAVKAVNNQYGNGRAIFAEQVVPLVGKLIGAPVPQVARVNIPQELIDAGGVNVHGTPVPPGLHHGSEWAIGFGDRSDIQYVDQNREDLGAASVLYAWTRASDHQLIYQNDEPHRVLSVDHGAFFADSGQWDAATLSTNTVVSQYDPFFDSAGLTDADRSSALDQLEAVEQGQIAEIVATPPTTWSATAADRAAVCDFLWARRSQVLKLSGRLI